jgi:hypothetical protein
MPIASSNVRVRGQSGKHLLALSFSQFDPMPTLGADTARSIGGPPREMPS